MLRAIGTRTDDAATKLAETLASKESTDKDRRALVDALVDGLESLDDEQAAEVVAALVAVGQEGGLPTAQRVADLIEAHSDEDPTQRGEFIADCVSVNPPEQIDVRRRLSQK